ncbi:MAG: hypothetical protein ACM3WU_06240 [Bacillota bacterium]
MQEPLSSEMWRFEPDLSRHLPPDAWRIRTNFVEPKDILRRFGVWPDDVLTPERLDALYSGETAEGPCPITVTFLDDKKAAAIEAIWKPRRDPVIRILQDGLSSIPGLADGNRDTAMITYAGFVVLALQSLLILELRSREREIGMWDARTEGQRMGTLFAVRPSTTATFTRVDVMPLPGSSVLCVPWGGPFAEYAKLLPLLADRHSQRVLGSADEKLEVVPEGPLLKALMAAGLLRQLEHTYMNARWALTVPILNPETARRMIPCLARVAHGISEAVSADITSIAALKESGRYAGEEGSGDYLEMAYSVLMGMVFQWAMEKGIVQRPPQFRVTKSGPILERSREARNSTAHPLPGLAILKGAASIWDELRSACHGIG